MLLSFGSNKTFNSLKSQDVHLILREAQKDVGMHILSSGKADDDLYTVTVVDYDASNGKYVHYILVNANSDLDEGDIVIDYYEPQRQYHRYEYSVYRQKRRINVPKKQMGRTSEETLQFVDTLPAMKIASITVHTD